MDLSIIIPACNVQDYIAACLRSVTRCPRENIDMECLVVNDGSTDDTAAVVKRYIQRDGRIRLVSKENSGIFETRNRGLEEAAGRYVMFLEPYDRLCEDAWEHIEAAVEEEYADFTAFSYITLCENGKLKARMLPISDVVSTDRQEARRLMYAGTSFNTCTCKIFRTDIVRDNHIVFHMDLPVGEEFLFVAEYFGYCESFMMMKAMIVYCLQRNKDVMQRYSMEEELQSARVIHNFSTSAVARCNDKELTRCVRMYYLDVLTNLFYEYAKKYRRDKEMLMDVYRKVLDNKLVNEILDEVDEQAIRSGRKRYEYRLLSDKNTAKLQKHFRLKALI